MNIFEPDANHKFDHHYLFKDLDLDDEQTYGQRKFSKNMDKILYDLIKFYNKYYNKPANEASHHEEASTIKKKVPSKIN